MRLAISNIAWDRAEDDVVVDLLQRHGIDAVDLAPGKYFPDPEAATTGDIDDVARWWHDRGFEITGMQALLFGTTGLNVFGDAQSQSRLLQRLDAVCRIAAGLGGRRLVFGSPRQRDRGALSDVDAGTVATDFFRRAGDIAAAHEVVVCLEPNPVRYGCNFLTDSEAAAAMVRRIAHPAIRLQFDLGSLTINGEDVAVVVPDCRDLIGHIHLSEPDLAPLGDSATDHARAAAVIREHLPDLVAAIEMNATATETHPESIARALEVAQRFYS